MRGSNTRTLGSPTFTGTQGRPITTLAILLNLAVKARVERAGPNVIRYRLISNQVGFPHAQFHRTWRKCGGSNSDGRFNTGPLAFQASKRPIA